MRSSGCRQSSRLVRVCPEGKWLGNRVPPPWKPPGSAHKHDEIPPLTRWSESFCHNCASAQPNGMTAAPELAIEAMSPKKPHHATACVTTVCEACSQICTTWKVQPKTPMTTRLMRLRSKRLGTSPGYLSQGRRYRSHSRRGTRCQETQDPLAASAQSRDRSSELRSGSGQWSPCSRPRSRRGSARSHSRTWCCRRGRIHNGLTPSVRYR